jgi:hypothetical protein
MGARHLGLAHALVEELPHTLRALSRGETTEWRATVIARETACLSRPDPGIVDRELAMRPGGLAAMGDRAVLVETRKVAYRVDGLAFTRRAAKAESERRVTLRPAPDTMTVLSGLLPVRQGVAVLASLTRHADAVRSAGDARSRGQIMADTLVERVTGQATAAAVPLEVNLVMTDHTLLPSEPAAEATRRTWRATARCRPHWPGPGSATPTRRWLRRLYTAPTVGPGTGSLVAMDSKRRTFTGRQRPGTVPGLQPREGGARLAPDVSRPEGYFRDLVPIA